MSELKIRECRLDGRYDIRDCLGRGSYSEVYVAEDLAAGEGEPRTVVIKALNPYLQGVPDAELERTLIENFRNEAVALDRVRHPNIISRLGHGTAIDLQDRVFHYLVVEYLPGGDLQALCRHHPLPLGDALHYLEQVADGLSHAHLCGVIHRDIKPQNLLLTADQQTVKIADFGVAKIEAAEGAITRVGTDVYAAPEHHPLMKTGPLDPARRTRQLTPAADIYSLAKTTYMLLTGEAPRRFSQQPIADLPAPVADRPWASHVLRVLRRATRDDPAERYQSVRDFWDDLRDAALPKTELLRETDAEVRRFTSPLGPRLNAGVMTPAPPAPIFASPAAPHRPKGGYGSRQRIVVPFVEAEPGGGVPETARNGRQVRVQSPADAYAAPEDVSYSEPRPTGRLRKWLVALLLLAAFAGMLFATHRYVSGLRGRGDPARASDPARPPAVGREFIATTDVNLRGGPARNTPKVGLAEINSVVKVLEVNGNWYRVSVVEHGRPKQEPDSADEGWAHNSFFRAR